MRETLRKSLGIVIKRRREHLALSQNQLALRSNLHRTYISDIERGARNPSFDSICCLSKGLGVLPSLLFAEAELDAYKSAGERIIGQDAEFAAEANPVVSPENMTVSLRAPVA